MPEIPSAIEVARNGINLGEMNAKLLKKIEELTLYLIHKDKQDQKQQKQINQLRKEVKALIEPVVKIRSGIEYQVIRILLY